VQKPHPIKYARFEETDTYRWIVVRSDDLPPAVYYKVGYSFVDEHTVKFDDPDDWEVVQLSYTPSSLRPPIAENSMGKDEAVPLEATAES
jgi:hypothetical protein